MIKERKRFSKTWTRHVSYGDKNIIKIDKFKRLRFKVAHEKYMMIQVGMRVNVTEDNCSFTIKPSEQGEYRISANGNIRSDDTEACILVFSKLKPGDYPCLMQDESLIIYKEKF